MRKPSALSAAISGILIGAAVAPQGAAVAQTQNEPEILEEIITTGSRIVRTDKFDTAGHVVNIDEQAIDALAVLNVADVLRASPLNAYGSFNERSGSSAQSNATFDLRGLGSQRTLVLFDGMRLPGSPALGADVLNINMLPMVAIKRMDILADGASAVYGSDAVAGVVNLVPHREFDGVEITARYGDRDRDDGGDASFGILAGATGDRSSIVFAAEWSKRDPIFDRDREFTAPYIDDSRGNGDGQIDAYIDTDGISYYGRTWQLYDPVTGHYELQAATDCPTTDGFTGVMGALAFASQGDPSPGTLCTYAYAGVSANRAELEKSNIYLYGEFDVSDRAQMYARGLFAKNDSFGRYAAPAAPWTAPPPSHPHNPYDLAGLVSAGTISECDGTPTGCLSDTDADGNEIFFGDPGYDAQVVGDPNYNLLGFYRWTNIGPRNNYVSDTQIDASLGFKGDINDDVSFDFYAQVGEYTSVDSGEYYLSITGLNSVLASGGDPFTPQNTFAMRANPRQDNSTEQNKVYGHVQFSTGDLFGAGEAIALAGAEYVEIEYVNKYDPASEAGLIGGSAGNSSAGERDFTSVFFEWLLPVSENSELNVAARWDDYSDFGSAVSPTISYNINVTDSLALRARWGQGFKAPSLSDLFGPETFSAESADDPVTGASRQFSTYIFTNPDLDAEESESISLGANWEYADGHSVDIAYYNVSIEDVITTPSTQSLLFADAAGVAFDPNGSRVERIGSGQVSQVVSISENGDELEVSGIDLQLASTWDTNAGIFDARLFWSYQMEYKQNAYFRGGFQDTAGFNLQPDTRAQAAATWSRGNNAVDLVVNYIGGHSEQDFVDDATGALTTSSSDLDSWTTANMAYRYDGGNWGQVKIGANNITDEDPVFDRSNKYGDGHENLYDAIGRVYFLEYRKSFE